MLLSRLARFQRYWAIPAVFMLVASWCLVLCADDQHDRQNSTAVTAVSEAHTPCHGSANTFTVNASDDASDSNCDHCDAEPELISSLQLPSSIHNHHDGVDLLTLNANSAGLLLSHPHPPPSAKRPLYLTKNVFLI